MTTYDASLDYWTERATQLGKTAGSAKIESDFGVDEINEIVALEDLAFNKPPSSSRFRETHPRFIWFVLANIILSPLLVYVGFQILDSHPPTVLNALMISSGSQTISAADLVTLVKSEHKLAYWVNPVAGDSYSNNSTEEGVNSISYMPAGARPKDLSQVSLTIKTYRDMAIYNEQLQPLAGPNETVITTANGTHIEFDEGLPNRMIVSFPRKPEIIVVQYPTTQNVTTLMRDAANLRPIA